MSLKHAIVGFLLERPMHGYELKRALSPALAREGHVNDGVLYPILRRLEHDGLVTKKIVAGDHRPDRHVLHPTKKAERWFAAWLENADDEHELVTYDFFIGHPFLEKCMFFHRLAPADVRAKLAAQKQSGEAKLASFEAIRRGMVERHVDPYRIAILDLGIAQHREKLRWLDELARDPLRRPRRTPKRRQPSKDHRP
jgi:DNA-binding PadR family transcriptional regulator